MRHAYGCTRRKHRLKHNVSGYWIEIGLALWISAQAYCLTMAICFQFVVHRGIGQTLGLRCTCGNGEALVWVNEIEEGGVIDKQNKRLESYGSDIRDQVLRTGDVIQCVNGQTQPHAIMRQLCIGSVIHMRIGRGALAGAVDALAAIPAVDRYAEFFVETRSIFVAENYDPRRVEAGGGYLCLTIGERVEIRRNSLAPGDSTNSYDWYFYGSCGPRSGWFPPDVLASNELQ